MPGLNLHTSNQLERLADALAAVVRAPLASPFQPETIVVQSRGMERWLRLELARRLGVCANFEFPFPRAFEREVLADALPGRKPSDLFEPDSMLWKIMALLPALVARPGFDGPRNYLGTKPDPRKRFQFAQRIAKAFDQYLLYRPRMILEWDQGKDDGWQSELWREVGGGLANPAALRRELMECLAKSRAAPAGLPARISIFGVAALPPFHLELFSALGRHMDVHLFLLQPCREWWGDIVTARREVHLRRQHGETPGAEDLHVERGHRLLASLGRQGREFLGLVSDQNANEPADNFAEPGTGSLLACLQSDILNLCDRGAKGVPPTAIKPGDDSIQVHSCHSPLRELEVLHDHMLDWFTHDASLEPRDILVMMPDLEDYAPFVQAVFGASESEARRIPFSLADRGMRQSSPLVDTFLTLLRMSGSRFGAASVLALLDSASVRARFGIAEADLELVRGWVADAGIRWGEDAAHRARFDVPAFTGNTWREGLDRLLLGYAMAGDDQLFRGSLPHGGIEGTPAATLGHFTEFVTRLFETCRSLEEHRPPGCWAETLREVLDQFFAPDNETVREAQAVRAALADLSRCASRSGFDEAVPLAVILEQLGPALEEDRSGAGFLGGGVTFCALKPMRSIPFKVICLVGMSDNTFPRPVQEASFDLMAQRHQEGDSSRREDDRYLFLETLLSARERLFISYTGQSARDNSEAPPSVLVSELLDCLAQGFVVEPLGGVGVAAGREVDSEARLREHLVTRHRLQAFSEEYFKGGRLFSYSDENCAAARAIRTRPGTAPASFAATPASDPADDKDADWREVHLDDLAEFFANPAKFFVSRRLRVMFPNEQGAIDECEPFGLDALESFKLREELLRLKLAGVSPETARDLISASGQLPPGALGTATCRALCAEVDAFHARVRPHTEDAACAPVVLEVAVGAFRLIGRFDRFSPAGLLQYRCAKIKPADRLRLWVRHVVWNHPANLANAARNESILVGLDETLRYAPVPDAEMRLAELLGLYWAGLRQPLKFFADASLTFATSPAPAARQLAEKKWSGTGQEGSRAECEDKFYKLCFPGFELDQEFEALALKVCGPLLACEQKVKD